MRAFPIGALLGALLVSGAALAETLTVYKSPYCGCCKHWISHMRSNGFTVEVIDQQNMSPVKERLGVKPGLSSCHTATVEGYLIEGHVPAEDVKRLLAERPKVRGLAVPGMPVGSPGMEDPAGKRWDPYEVIAFGGDNQPFVYAKHNQKNMAKEPAGDGKHQH